MKIDSKAGLIGVCAGILLYLLGVLVFWGAVIYVVCHFARKFW